MVQKTKYLSLSMHGLQSVKSIAVLKKFYYKRWFMYIINLKIILTNYEYFKSYEHI